MKKIIFCSFFILLFNSIYAFDINKYEQVTNDPLGVRIYTLDNGLKVYLCSNKNSGVNITAQIVVKAGSKNDPQETTGLAHYFEHMMFKGTTNYGTTNYIIEKVHLDQIENLFEIYRVETDSVNRKMLYGQIDSISMVASQYAIPNEYAKMMSTIGAANTDANTGYDLTTYKEIIPINQVNNWLNIQYERFSNPIFRLFHTELETVYEEYNFRSTDDYITEISITTEALCPDKPYYYTSVIGKADHIKNPSVRNLKSFYETYYIPNNMAMVMVGDFDTDSIITAIDRTFGKLKKKEIPQLVDLGSEVQPSSLNEVQRREYIRSESNNVSVIYRLPVFDNAKDIVTLQTMAELLNVELMKKIQDQSKSMNAVLVTQFSEYTLLRIELLPIGDTPLRYAEDVIFKEVDKMRKRKMEKSLSRLLPNMKVSNIQNLLDNEDISNNLIESFSKDIRWSQFVDRTMLSASITPDDIRNFCKEYLKNNCVVIYGKAEPKEYSQIDKPQITSITINQEAKSDFYQQIEASSTTPIQPLFVDFDKDIQVVNLADSLEVLYKMNSVDSLYSFSLIYPLKSDKYSLYSLYSLASTEKKANSFKQLRDKMKELGTQVSFMVTDDEFRIGLAGVSDNFEQSCRLLERFFNNLEFDKKSYENFKEIMHNDRMQDKVSLEMNWENLLTYVRMSGKSKDLIMSEGDLDTISGKMLFDTFKKMRGLKHSILYFGSKSLDDLSAFLEKEHCQAKTLLTPPIFNPNTLQTPDSTKLYLMNYSSAQTRLSMTKNITPYTMDLVPIVNLYNNYIDGDMGSVAFQFLREAKSLTYAFGVNIDIPNNTKDCFTFNTYVVTQGSKVKDVIETVNEMILHFPENQVTFDRAKEKVLSEIRTQRVLREDVLYYSYYAKKKGFTEDPVKYYYEKIQSLTLEDLLDFHNKYITGGNPFIYSILGEINTIDTVYLESLGEVTVLRQEDIFGY